MPGGDRRGGVVQPDRAYRAAARIGDVLDTDEICVEIGADLIAAALDPADFTDAASLLKKAGMTLVSTVGGASGRDRAATRAANWASSGQSAASWARTTDRRSGSAA